MKNIPLTQGQFASVDDEYFDLINQYKWYANESGNTYYAAREITVQSKNIKRKQKIIYMHRIIMENILERKLEKNEEVDHINSNGLDNRKSNLRICTHQQNLSNQNKISGTSSKYKGVTWHKNRKKWLAQIGLNEKKIYLGYFNNEVHAAKAYDKKATELFGKFAKLNFGEIK